MKNDIKDSVVDNLNKTAYQLKTVRDDIRKLTNFSNSLEKEILDTIEIYDIDIKKLKHIKLIEEFLPQQIPLEQILEVFPNSDIELILKNIVGKIEINLEKTRENLKFSANFQEILVNSIIKQLSKLAQTSVVKVEIK